MDKAVCSLFELLYKKIYTYLFYLLYIFLYNFLNLHSEFSFVCVFPQAVYSLEIKIKSR